MNRRHALALFSTLAASAADPIPPLPRPGPKDLCPVCGMIVSKYPDWIATVLWNDGRAHHFDGPKDLFLFLFALPRYAPGRRREEIRFLAVTTFYDLKRIDATTALYVSGSDVLSPMGHDLIPHPSPSDAQEFLKDHKGKRILRFNEVTPALIAAVEQGR